ncbi:ABC transporter permease subunit [Sanguibacter antarcticus]|uniref:ABC-2 family transporter n=1 Tax=Sanguibacter antarcticus TaxID=372484 RepID=A0A2A9E573_9MICO|nr:ABC transporter permease subunit [Sanguibacter antarcticus]PFG34197.1 ABC-2 family transporter [Sanguibacter antarcticus]
MFGELLVNEVHRRKVGAGTLALVLAAFGALALAIADSIGGLMQQITDGFPDALTTFIGADAPGGYVVGEMFSLIFPVAVVVFAVLVGAGSLAGEERDGTMAIVSAQPVTRTQVLWAKATGVVLSLVLVVGLNWVVMAAFVTADATELTLAGLTGGTLHLLFLGLTMASLAFAVAAATGRPGLAGAVAGGIAVVAYLMATMLPVAGLESWARLSPWYYYLGRSDPLTHGADLADLGLLAAITTVCTTVAVLTFRTRDLKG